MFKTVLIINIKKILERVKKVLVFMPKFIFHKHTLSD